MSLGDWVEWDKCLIDNIMVYTGMGVADIPEYPTDIPADMGNDDWRNSPAMVNWYKQCDHAALKWIPPAPVGFTLKATPVTQNYAHVGTAFDYAMRCLLSLWNGVELSGRLRPQEGYIPAFVPSTIVAHGGCGRDKRRLEFLDSFYSRLNSYTSKSRGTDEGEERDFILSLLPDCVILANLESVYRSGQDYGNDAIFSVNPGDVADLATLLKLVDRSTWISRGKTFDKIVHPSLDFARYSVPCFLNPSFGDSSLVVGGGDADIILDGCLIDIKTVKSSTVRYKDYLRQLIGYWVLNLREGDPYGITSLGIYFSRHGFLHRFSLPTQDGAVIRRDSKGRCCPVGWGDDLVAGCTWDDIEESIREYNGENEDDR